MGAKNFLVVGGSSGIGLEIVKKLHEKGNGIYVGSRTNDQLTDLDGVHHFTVDVTAESFNLDGLPEVMRGMVYCPAKKNGKPRPVVIR
jgi:NAD(P)-dependent dehydrogenase (short-subunit alcohol dehydrogenase family)